MEKPYKFTAIHQETKEIREFDSMLLRPYVPMCEPDKWTIYIDTRYEAKLRLWRYVNGIKPKPYRPYEGTEIGKSIPILNF